MDVKRKKLEQSATALLKAHGYNAMAQPKGKKRTSIRAILTPCGGQPGYRR